MQLNMRHFLLILLFSMSFSSLTSIVSAADASEFRSTDVKNAITNRTQETGKQKKCLFVMSYHKGYEWNDGIDDGVTEKLTGICQLKKIYLDTKRNPSIAFGQAAGLKAKSIVEQYKPDVLIVADDNASRFLAEPFYKNKLLPVVFVGLNWTASEYGYPYQNATGMVEVAPIIPLLKIIRRSIGVVQQGVYLSSNVITEHKDFLRYEQEYKIRGVALTPVFVSTMKEWKAAYLKAQQADFIIVNNNAGINDWAQAEIMQFVQKNARVLTVTNYSWMMSYAMLGMTKDPVEQGQWAGDVAAAILNGLSVAEIPVTINKSWLLFANEILLKTADISLGNRVLNYAHKAW